MTTKTINGNPLVILLVEDNQAHAEVCDKTPVVILTTSTAERDVAGAYEAHANSHLVKPVDFEKFAALMSELGFYWLGWNHYPWSEPRT